MNVEFSSFPSDTTTNDPEAYRTAMSKLQAGDLVFIFTPDDLHYPIAKEAIERGLHVLVTKPAVKTLKEHRELAALASKYNVLCCVEVHKRWDPMYADARVRIRTQLGDFSYFSSYMSQPKKQLVTFRSWAGKASDISYYLNSHHVDFHCWALQNIALPEYTHLSLSLASSSLSVVSTREQTNLGS
jgi:D-galacturonate reductase